MAEEEAAEGAEEEEEGGGGSKKMMMIIIIVLVLAGGGAGAFFAMGGGGDAEEDFGDEDDDDGGGGLPGAILPLDTFIVNLGVKGSFLKTDIQLEFFEPEPPLTIDADLPKIRDSIIRTLSAKSAAELLTIEGKEKLREEVKTTVNESLGAEDIMQIYFTEFIIQ